MSSSIFPQFLFLIGLNFINVIGAEPHSGPVYRFAEKLDLVPSGSYYDAVAFADSTWFASDGLYRYRGDLWEPVIAGERVTALTVAPTGDNLWYGGSDRVVELDRAGNECGSVSVESGFIWSLVWHKEALWYFASDGFGWLDPDTFQIGQHWPESFSPRPFVNQAGDALFVSSYEGLWEIGKNGRNIVLPISATGQPINWLERENGGYLLGTTQNIYRWSGKGQDVPVPLNSNYGEFFKKGINNSVSLEDRIAIVEYPLGVALWNRHLGRISEFVSSNEGLPIGDVFKIRQLERDKIVILGEEGVGLLDLSIGSTFFPASELWGNDDLKEFISSGDAAYLFTDRAWIRLFDDGFETGELLRTANWVDLAPDGNPVLGAINIYEKFNGSDWVDRELTHPIMDFKWGASRGYALGAEGIYTVSEQLDLRLVYRDNRQMELVGEYGKDFFALSGANRLLRLSEEPEGWTLWEVPHGFDGPVVEHGVAENGIWLATETSIYNWDEGKLKRHDLAPGWIIRSMGVTEREVFVLYEDIVTRRLAIGVYEEAGQLMLSMPYMDRLGEPLGLMGNQDRLGVVGTHGVGWYRVEELPRLTAPKVDFDLLLEDKRIEDRTIPSGMHFIDLQVNFSEPGIPSLVQYRINEQRWRNVNLQDPSLQFAGHGNFTVELRAMHPNGSVSSSKLVQFGIAPPWYLNPLYQGIMLIVALLIFWGLFALRSAQLKRTNLWLQSEVKKQTRELEAATAARTNFLAGLSHDIRNPLNGVLMITETLTRNPPKSGDDPRLRDLTEFGVIVDRMLGEILDFSAIDQKNIPTAFIPVAVHDIIESSVKQNQFGILHEMINLNTVISPELKDVVIRTDRNWMIKIMSNLLINALQYSETDRVEIGARCINITDHEVDLELYVADWGIGIDASEKEFIFERFYRGESGVESGKHGTGLGLSICQEIAHAMGGHLRLESNEPSGCRFILKGRFDRVEGSLELDKEAVLAQLKGKKILVVDDLVYNRRSVVEFFETIGCHCDEAENGREALKLLDQNPYYLALLDWDLPGLTGPEIARRHRKQFPDDEVILVAVTAYTDGEKKRESQEAGMNGYISKPLTAARLAHCLANIQNWKPEVAAESDSLANDEVMEEIYKHIDDCLLYGDRYEWENLRRCAHRLTTLALIRNNRAMQQVCRDLQVSAEKSDLDEIHVGLLELQKWRRS